jgi:hypothetical protein
MATMTHVRLTKALLTPVASVASIDYLRLLCDSSWLFVASCGSPWFLWLFVASCGSPVVRVAFRDLSGFSRLFRGSCGLSRHMGLRAPAVFRGVTWFSVVLWLS